MRMTRAEYEAQIPSLPEDVQEAARQLLSQHDGTHVYFDREMFIMIERGERQEKLGE